MSGNPCLPTVTFKKNRERWVDYANCTSSNTGVVNVKCTDNRGVSITSVDGTLSTTDCSDVSAYQTIAKSEITYTYNPRPQNLMSEMMRSGASLIQVYSSFIYQGPKLVKQLVQGL